MNFQFYGQTKIKGVIIITIIITVIYIFATIVNKMSIGGSSSVITTQLSISWYQTNLREDKI